MSSVVSAGGSGGRVSGSERPYTQASSLTRPALYRTPTSDLLKGHVDHTAASRTARRKHAGAKKQRNIPASFGKLPEARGLMVVQDIGEEEEEEQEEVEDEGQEGGGQVDTSGYDSSDYYDTDLDCEGKNIVPRHN